MQFPRSAKPIPPLRPPRSRRWILAALALGIGFALRLIFPPPPAVKRDEPRGTEVPEATTSAAAPAEIRVYLGPGSPLAPQLNAPDGDGQRDVETLYQITGALLSSLKGENRPPLGNNADFAAALRGRNKLHLVLLPAGHPAYDSEGRLCDRWGAPYHFHAVSSDWVEIRSAGPDGELFTNDDFVDTKTRKKKNLFRE